MLIGQDMKVKEFVKLIKNFKGVYINGYVESAYFATEDRVLTVLTYGDRSSGEQLVKVLEGFNGHIAIEVDNEWEHVEINDVEDM